MRAFGSAVASRQIGAFQLSLKRYERNAMLPWHEHSTPYLTFVLSGAYRESLRTTAHECSAHTVVYHPPGELHADAFGDVPTECLDVNLDRAWLAGLHLRGCATDRPAFITSTIAARIGARVQRELHRPDRLSPMAVEALLLELFCENERNDHRGAAPAWLRRVRDQLEGSVTAVSLSEMARDAGVHPTHLARSFRAHYGCSIGEFVRARRIERAKDQMRGDGSLADIALELGFADQSHFSRTFRRFTGQSPAEFRRDLR